MIVADGEQAPTGSRYWTQMPFFLFGQNLRADTYVEKKFSSFFGFPPFPCFSSTDSPLTWPAQNSAGSSLLLLICLPIQLLLQVTYLTQKIHFFRQPRTRRTIEQQISVIVNSETNLTFNLLAPAGDLGIIPFEKIFWEKRASTFRKGLTINEALEIGELSSLGQCRDFLMIICNQLIKKYFDCCPLTEVPTPPHQEEKKMIKLGQPPPSWWK